MSVSLYFDCGSILLLPLFFFSLAFSFFVPFFGPCVLFCFLYVSDKAFTLFIYFNIVGMNPAPSPTGIGIGVGVGIKMGWDKKDVEWNGKERK